MSRSRRLAILPAALAGSLALLNLAAGTPGQERSASQTVPVWIWASEARTPGVEVTLRSTVEVPGPVERARLRCAADFARVEVRLDGQAVVVGEDYGPWIDEDVASCLQPGATELSLRCVGSEGPSAIALSLEVTCAGGASLRVLTDPRWEARVNSAPAAATPHSPAEGAWTDAVAFARVAPELWGVGARSIRIDPFDDYEQWREALGAEEDAEASTFLLPEGFEIQRLRAAGTREGSWINIAFDPEGRLVVAREDKGLLRMTLSDDRDQVTSVETINDSLRECRGLLFAYDALYVNANVSGGLYRLRDTTTDGRFDEVALLRRFPGGEGHGRNDLALGPDGMIYSIHGDAVDLPGEPIVDRTSPFRRARRGERTREGSLVRTDRDGTRWELVCAGLRNPFGIDFHPEHGEAFTYDADAEHDMGAPWYRPTRVVHLVSGADYGWRGVTGEWPPYDPDRPENAVAALDIGKGSPTAVKFGARSRFPPRYRRALFILDWAYGRILAVHLAARGAGYTGQAEVFLRGRPLNVTDLDFGPDGAMYVVTGGRRTQSALYRVRYVGPEVAAASPTRHQRERADYSRHARKQRRLLEALHGHRGATVIDALWPYLDGADPTLRHAARVVLEEQPRRQWQDRALTESRPTAALTALLALARSGQEDLTARILEHLDRFDLKTLDAVRQLILLRIYELCLSRDETTDRAPRVASMETLSGAFPDRSARALVPLGLGRNANRVLSRLLVSRDVPDAVSRTATLLRQAEGQEESLHFLRVLSSAREGWTTTGRRSLFRALNDAERYRGGHGMPGFLQTIREQAVETLTSAERRDLAAWLEPPAAVDAEPLRARPLVKEWMLEDLAGSLTEAGSGRDHARGKRMFREAHCSRCHRLGLEGTAIGPDLTSVASRFSRRDLLESILSPSLVVAPPYRGVEVVTKDGRVLTGRLVTGGDYRSQVLKIVTDPLRPSQAVEIRKQDIRMHRESPTSPMPEGLLNTLGREEILDLLAYLESGGDERHPTFHR